MKEQEAQQTFRSLGSLLKCIMGVYFFLNKMFLALCPFFKIKLCYILTILKGRFERKFKAYFYSDRTKKQPIRFQLILQYIAAVPFINFIFIDQLLSRIYSEL